MAAAAVLPPCLWPLLLPPGCCALQGAAHPLLISAFEMPVNKSTHVRKQLMHPIP